VLVHCFAGASRSATIVIAYLMKKNSWTLEHTLEYVKSRRSIVSPHEAFLEQLKKYEKALNEKKLIVKDIYKN